jgi:phosphoenolpyruvate-protein kinase (PTS system EI component)
VLPLLVGLGVDELSVGAARVGATRAAVRALDSRDAARVARASLTDPGAPEVAARVRRELLGQPGDAATQRLERERPVVTVGDQP